MTHFTKAYWTTFLAIVTIIVLADLGPIMAVHANQLGKILSDHYQVIIATVSGFIAFNFLVYLTIHWLFYRPICKLINFGFLSCCCVGIMVCLANYFMGEYVFGPSIIEYWWLMVIPGVLYGIVFNAIYFCFNNGFKTRW